MRKEPNYLYLMIALLTAVVLITSASPVSVPGILGVFTAALSLLGTAYILTDRRRQLLLAVLGSGLPVILSHAVKMRHSRVAYGG